MIRLQGLVLISFDYRMGALTHEVDSLLTRIEPVLDVSGPTLAKDEVDVTIPH